MDVNLILSKIFMDQATRKRLAIARYTGSGFFVFLAMVHFVCGVAANKFHWYDLLMLIATCVPIIADKRWLYRFYGIGYVVLAIGFGVSHAFQGHQDSMVYVITWIADILSVFAALSMIYGSVTRSVDEVDVEGKCLTIK